MQRGTIKNRYRSRWRGPRNLKRTAGSATKVGSAATSWAAPEAASAAARRYALSGSKTKDLARERERERSNQTMSRGRGIGNDDGGGGSQQLEQYLAIGGGEGQIEEQQGRGRGQTDRIR